MEYYLSVRAAVNLEACGTSGPEILFQANSMEMINAYSRVPYPHGTVTANEVFATGIIISDTDYVQFVKYGNLSAVDMALYKNSYLYHTHLDLVDYTQPGTVQHMGENTMALLEYLTTEADLEKAESSDGVIFFDLFGKNLPLFSVHLGK